MLNENPVISRHAVRAEGLVSANAKHTVTLGPIGLDLVRRMIPVYIASGGEESVRAAKLYQYLADNNYLPVGYEDDVRLEA